jgi:NAD(P)-dependent dehydrogenase (short-subunit alcohol dehydrogenase family)
MQGKTCLVTGATSGIGRVTAGALAQQGANVVLVGRDPDRTKASVVQIQAETGNKSVTGLIADLSSQKEVSRLAVEYQSRFERLDVLVNNAGAIFHPRKLSTDGIEMTFALNHLAYFSLTHKLLDLLVASAPSRIVNVASDAHRGARLDFDNLQGERHYDAWHAYRQSKLANLAFTYALADRLAGSGVTVNALHPGFVATNFGRNNTGLFGLLIRLSMHLGSLSPRKAAKTMIYLASSADVTGVTGWYFRDGRQIKSSTASYDRQAAQRLWQISLALTGFQDESPAPPGKLDQS